MLKFLSKVRIEFNALDPRTAACMEFLAQCNARTAKESNPGCQVLVKRRTDSFAPQIAVTFVNGVEEVFDATTTPAQTIRTMILQKGQQLETEQMFREAGEKWPVLIPEEELHQHAPGTKAAIDSLTRSLALEWGTDHDVRVNGIAPGPIQVTTGYSKIREERAGYKAGEKWDIAMAALYLASDAGKYVNGTTLVVDGGMWFSGPRHISKEALKQLSRNVEKRSRSAPVGVPKSKL